MFHRCHVIQYIQYRIYWVEDLVILLINNHLFVCANLCVCRQLHNHITFTKETALIFQTELDPYNMRQLVATYLHCRTCALDTSATQCDQFAQEVSSCETVEETINVGVSQENCDSAKQQHESVVSLDNICI